MSDQRDIDKVRESIIGERVIVNQQGRVEGHDPKDQVEALERLDRLEASRAKKNGFARLRGMIGQIRPRGTV